MSLQVPHDCRPPPLVQSRRALYNVQKVPTWEEWEPRSTEVYGRFWILGGTPVRQFERLWKHLKSNKQSNFLSKLSFLELDCSKNRQTQVLLFLFGEIRQTISASSNKEADGTVLAGKNPPVSLFPTPFCSKPASHASTQIIKFPIDPLTKPRKYRHQLTNPKTVALSLFRSSTKVFHV
jgi:hypothetical protein